MDYLVEEMKPADWPQVSAIYWEGIQTKISTFQAEIPSWEKWDRSHSQFCRIVAKRGETVLGWAALSPVSDRCVYAGVADVSIYVGKEHRYQGIGQALMFELIQRSEERGFWTLNSGIIRENSASQALHAKCGFRTIGVREKIGKMDNGIWHDVVIMERRSQRVGIE